VVDDPHNVIERESDAVRMAALTWWDETMSTRLNNPRTGSKVIVMQRIHEKDLSGHVLKQGGYVHLCLPAEFELSRRCVTVIGWKDPREAERDLLWKDRIGEKEIADFKVRLGPEGYAGQFQQRPAPAGGGRFKAEWFRYYIGGKEFPPRPVLRERDEERALAPELDGDPATESQDPHPNPLPAYGAREQDGNHRPDASNYTLLHPDGSSKTIAANDCHRFAVMDPAGTEPGDGRRPCYTVIQVWDITPTGEMLLVYQYRRQVQAPDAAAEAVKICREFEVDYIAIEKDGMGLGVVQHVRREGVAVRAIKARGSKEARSQTAEIRMSAGSIYFPLRAPFLFELEKELLSFPNSEYADQVDALSHAAMLVQKIGGSETDTANDPLLAMEQEIN
jgi:predicted phage terminase large subunit-like protein